MASAVQPKVVSPQFSSASRSADNLVARLRISAEPGADLLLNPTDAGAREPGTDRPFIISRNAAQRDNGLVAAVIGAPLVPAEETGSTGSDTRHIDAHGLLDLYEAGGQDCLTQLQGAWAVVIVDPQKGCILLANDRMGRQPLFYSINDDSVLMGSSLDSLRLLCTDTGLDAQALYHYTYFHMVPAPGAAIDGFQKLESASVLELTPDRRTLARYWTPTFHERFGESSAVTAASAHEELRRRLKTAVKRCVVAGGDLTSAPETAETETTRVGAFLSGGLDSSTVAGMLSEVQGGSADAYAIGFDAEGYDEMPFARLAAQHFGVRLHEHYVTPEEVVRVLPDIAAAFDEPFGNSSVLPAYFCAHMAAEDGVEVLLAGDGGDELFAGNERYASQRIFERYRSAPRWLRAGLIEPLVRALPQRLPLVAKGRSFLRQANTPLPDRLQYYSFLEQNRPEDVFSAQFLWHIDQSRPLQRLNDIYHLPQDASALNRMLFLDWQTTLADNDLRKVNQACALAGVKVRYPMLDDELVEFSCRIPSAWKLPASGATGSRLRDFYKQGLTGWLPDETINKSKHGFGLPFGVWMKNHKPLQEMAYENIGQLKARGIFLPQFLDQAIASHRHGHAAYFGELIWILTCLEFWLAANEPAYRVED